MFLILLQKNAGVTSPPNNLTIFQMIVVFDSYIDIIGSKLLLEIISMMYRHFQRSVI